ncbi:hypothetical protein F4777DRAFT_575205 [Nemania sp. FL0916]|nr:hypothetical protein F4777DRAFT_575205 [Nemania sp. FL0916]
MASGPNPDLGQPPRPLSPWARRYGKNHLANDVVFDRSVLEHSQFAPEHPPLPSLSPKTGQRNHRQSPSLHPTFYADRPSLDGTGTFASGDEEDKFFITDFALNNITRGIAPWQVGATNRHIQFLPFEGIPSGHHAGQDGQVITPLYERLLIVPDEDTWLPVFRKDRWFSRASPHLNVDDPVVWRELRISLELANRILLALVKDKHVFLQTMLYGVLSHWINNTVSNPPSAEPAPNAQVLLSHSYTANMWTTHAQPPGTSFPLADVPTKTEEEWRHRLIELTSNVDWAFTPIQAATRRTDGIMYHALNIITLDVTKINMIIQNRFTPAERCVALVTQASTILHELMHAIGTSRKFHDPETRYSTLAVRTDDSLAEPYIDYGGAAELGYAFENAVFGGVLRDACEWADPDTYIPFANHLIKWPFMPRVDDPTLGANAPADHPDFGPDRDNAVTIVPSIWFSRLLSDHFWTDDTRPRKSDDFFQRLDYWRTTSWYNSAWGYSHMRALLSEFLNEMKNSPGERDRFLLAERANLMARSVPYDANHDIYCGRLDIAGDYWVWSAVGLLMLATLPIERSARTRLPNTQWETLYFFPSDANQGPRRQIRWVPSTIETPERPTTISVSEVFDPFGRDGEVIPVDEITHFHFLDLVRNMIYHFAGRLALVSRPWLDEILRMEDLIRSQRQRELNGDSPHVTFWADDVFRQFSLPVYQPFSACIYNQGQNDWVDV